MGNLKPFIVVIVFAIVMFASAKPVCVKYMSQPAFSFRRNVWLALTTVAFFSPSFWLYAAVATVILIAAYRREENPLALYVLVSFTAPNARYFIPFPLLENLFDLTQYRMLSLIIIVPLTIKWANTRVKDPRYQFTLIDAMMLGFVAIQVALQVSYENPTNTLRRAFLLFLDVYLFVVAFARIDSKKKIVDLMACFWLSCILMAPVAVFEWAKGWLLYTGLNEAWGDPNSFSYLMRGDFLRAQAATGHSLNLGYVSVVGLGFFLYLRQGLNVKLSWLFGLLSAAAILSSASRGALLAALIVLTVFFGFRPDAARRLARIFVVASLIFAAMYFSPLKESVIDRLPVIGTSDQENIEYRRVLLEASWTVIKQHPFFGDPFAANQLEFLRQGQGIIDIVNGYVYFALFTGLVGVSLLVGSMLLVLQRALALSLKSRRLDGDTALLGASLVAVFLGTLFFVGTAGFSSTVYILMGLLASYAGIGRKLIVVPVKPFVQKSGIPSVSSARGGL